MSFTFESTSNPAPYQTPYPTSYSAPSSPYPRSTASPSASTSTAAAPPATAAPFIGPAFDNEFASQLALQSSIYTPEGARKFIQQHPTVQGHARKTVLRKAAHFRLFCGNLDSALPDETFTQTFNKWPSFVKAHLVRDHLSNKVKYGFVAFADPEDMLKAWRELNGKYVGMRPIKISKATTPVATVSIGERKARHFDSMHKPKTGTVPFSRAKLAEAEGGGLNGAAGPVRTRKSYIRR
ncbi:hypothetical protein RQP46_007751 [Phenoliferia psychrophenolica]